LYYRLNVIPIHIPPLRERKADIPLLVEYLLERFAAKGKGKAMTLSPRVMAILMDHDWPGNVRELENVLEHAVVCSRGGMIEPDALPRSFLVGTAVSALERTTGKDLAQPMSRLPASEMDAILRALEASRGNRGRAAEVLGIDRTTLWRRMRRLGITSQVR
jgi:transcriptional regulator with PAS, ATPase and Fis domain